MKEFSVFEKMYIFKHEWLKWLKISQIEIFQKLQKDGHHSQILRYHHITFDKIRHNNFCANMVHTYNYEKKYIFIDENG